VIRVYDGVGNVTETHEQAGDLKKCQPLGIFSPKQRLPHGENTTADYQIGCFVGLDRFY
jgi:hypothetical protein